MAETQFTELLPGEKIELKRGRGRPRKTKPEGFEIASETVKGETHSSLSASEPVQESPEPLAGELLRLKDALDSYGFDVPDDTIRLWHGSTITFPNILRVVSRWEEEYELCSDLSAPEIKLDDRTGIPPLLKEFQSLDSEKADAIRSQGQIAARQKQGELRNPYPPESFAAAKWLNGFRDELANPTLDIVASEVVDAEYQVVPEVAKEVQSSDSVAPATSATTEALVPLAEANPVLVSPAAASLISATVASVEEIRRQREQTDRFVESVCRKREKIEELTSELIEAHEEIDSINAELERLKGEMKSYKEDLEEAVANASLIAKKIKDVRSGNLEFQTELPFRCDRNSDPQIPPKTAAEMDAEKQQAAKSIPVVDVGGLQDLDVLRKGRLQKTISVPCEGLGLSSKQVEKLKSEIGTGGSIADFEKFVKNNPWWHRDIKGFGEETVAKITDAWVAFRRDPKFAVPEPGATLDSQSEVKNGMPSETPLPVHSTTSSGPTEAQAAATATDESASSSSIQEDTGTAVAVPGNSESELAQIPGQPGGEGANEGIDRSGKTGEGDAEGNGNSQEIPEVNPSVFSAATPGNRIDSVELDLDL